MQNMDFSTFLHGLGNDLKIVIDDIIGIIENIHDDVKHLKTITSKPDKSTAKALLEFIAMEEGKAKENMRALCNKEIQQYFAWLDFYCMEYNCTYEQALNNIIEEQ